MRQHNMKSNRGQRTPRPARKSFRKLLEVPIYVSYLVLSVSDNIVQARQLEDDFLGEDPDLDKYEDCGGLACYWGNHFGLFLNFKNLTHGIIAHELLHTTLRILDCADVKYRTSNSEPFTYLNGFLTTWIYHTLHKAKLKVAL